MNARNDVGEEKNSLGVVSLLVAAIAIFIVGAFLAGNIVIAIIAGILSLVLALLFVIVSARLLAQLVVPMRLYRG